MKRFLSGIAASLAVLLIFVSCASTPTGWISDYEEGQQLASKEGKDLFLFHFGYFDLGRIKARFEDPSRRAAGWTKHLERRSKTIRQVTAGKALDWDRWTRNARILQTFVRPPYAWNKPAMFELVIIVRIADRFENIV
jgi:hypothetical protein